MDVLAKQSNGKYDFSNLTMVFRDLDIKKNDYKWEKEGRENYIINDFAFKYAYKRGMKIDAYIGDAKLKNVVYRKKGKYKPYLKYGELMKLKEGKDYELIIHDSPYPICQREVEIRGLSGGCFEGQSIKRLCNLLHLKK